MNEYHIPVMLQESIEALDIKPDGVYVDTTFGGGSHSREILKNLSSKGKLIAFDQDEDAIGQLIDDERFTFHSANFRFIKRFLKFESFHQVDGILADLGISSHHIDQPERGFSLRYDTRLDMRMDQKQEFDAYELINTYDKRRIESMFRDFGDLRSASNIAQAIIDKREEASIETTGQLNEILMQFFSETNRNKLLAMAYQAIRIEVNQEMQALRSMLAQAAELLAPGGRLCVISYHSIEDRIVKRFIKNGNFTSEPEKDFYGNPLSKLKQKGKPLIPSDDEVKDNNRARSARMRIAEKIRS